MSAAGSERPAGEDGGAGRGRRSGRRDARRGKAKGAAGRAKGAARKTPKMRAKTTRTKRPDAGARKTKGAATKKAGTKAAGRRRTARRRRPDPARVATVLEILERHDPDPVCALDHANPYELVVATILSAQCTDARVNMVTPALFARYPTPRELAAARREDVEELIQSTGFFRNKAKNLIGMARRLVEVYDGELPRQMDELLTLPGVARKTANVVRGVCWGLADGVVVDTHVKRIAARLGLTRETNPVKVERDLVEVLPREHWIDFSHRLIRHGRRTCTARAPDCEACPLEEHCPKVGVAR